MRRSKKIALRVTLAVVCVALAATALAWWWWAGSVPPRAGQHRVTVLGAPVSITWDPRGVPTIEARTLEDALTAEGFVHGLLRPMQTELRRRSVTGGVAAFAGPRLAGYDEDLWASGFQASAAREEASLTPDVRRAAEAYVAGLNAGLAESARRLPPAMRVARIRPEPWTVRDVLAFGRRFCSLLSNASDRERARLDLARRFGVDDAATLWEAAFGEHFPPVPEETRRILGLAPKERVPAAAAAHPGLDPELLARASNAWAVAPSRTAGGGALLAGDPHLGFELPSLWFEVRLRWPGGQVSGASLAGAPGVIIGHNEHVAWSFTVAAFDDADLFLVEVDDVEHPVRYREGQAWKNFELEQHRIDVRGEKPRTFVVRRAGPAVYAGASGIPHYGLLERQASRETGGLFTAIRGIDLAGSVDEALAAARAFPGPGQNFIAAGTDGTIVHAIVGAAPRRVGAGWDGRVPAPWTGTASWDGFVPREQMPSERNPARGFVWSANEDGPAARPGPGQVALPGDYEYPWRADRIRTRLEAMPRATPEDMAALQLDAHSGSSTDFAALLRTCAIDTAPARAYLAWDGTMGGNGMALVHEVFRGTLSERLRTKTRLGLAGGTALATPRAALGLLRAARENPWIASWLDDPATAWSEDPCDHVRRALDQAWDAVRKAAGGTPDGWTWERWHVLRLRSPVGIGPLARWFNAPVVGIAGASDAVLAEAATLPLLWDGAPLPVVHGPSYRIVAAAAGGSFVSRSALPGGEDEHPGAPHAFDRLDDYARGTLRPLVPAESAPSTQGTMTLQP